MKPKHETERYAMNCKDGVRKIIEEVSQRCKIIDTFLKQDEETKNLILTIKVVK